MAETKTYGLKELTLDALRLNIQTAPEELVKARYAVCEACPFLTAAKKCSRCGCYMPVKTKLTKATCPVKKW